MRRTRRMTSSERWELGLFLALLVVTFLCFTAILNLNNLPRLFAFHSDVAGAQAAPSPASPAIDPVAPPSVPQLATLELAPPAVPLMGGQALPLPAEQAAVTPVAPPHPLPKAKAPVARPKPDIKVYNGQKYRFVKTIQLRVTAYAPDPRCTWPYPGTTTASGLSVKTNGGRLVAADTNVIPMHALVTVPGYAGGAAVPVLDRGGAIKGRRLDVLMPTFDRAKDWGSRMLEVKVYMPVDE